MMEEIYLSKEVEKPLFNKIARLGLKIHKIDNQKAQSLAKGGNHQGFLAKISEFKFAPFSEVKSREYLTILYGLSDIGNIGAIVRTAHALGGGGVLWVAKNQPSSSAISGILRASSAAALQIPICVVSDAAATINELLQMGYEIFAAQAGASELKDRRFSPKSALLMGSEGDGLPAKIVQKCSEKISVKMRDGWDSLNVSCAHAILLNRIKNG